MTDLTDDELVQQAATEIGTWPHGPLELVLRPQSAFSLAAVLQLALRHPGLTGEPHRIAVTALAHIRAFFEPCPAVQEMLRRGDDPEHDR